jgi:hypothetical protein
VDIPVDAAVLTTIVEVDDCDVDKADVFCNVLDVDRFGRT